MIWWPFFFAFWVTFVTPIVTPSSEVERNPKMNISFFDNMVAIFFHISGDFHHSDCSADHQKLNVIQK